MAIMKNMTAAVKKKFIRHDTLREKRNISLSTFILEIIPPLACSANIEFVVASEK